MTVPLTFGYHYLSDEVTKKLVKNFMNKLTVITSIFNAEKFIKDALESGINQTYKNFDWILIDDCCTDKSMEMIEPIYNFFTSMLTHEKNLGQAASYNQAIELAKTEYITYLDADDLSKHKRFATQVEFLDKNPDIWCVGTHAIVIDQDDNFVGEYNYPPEKHEDIIKFLGKNRFSPMLHPSVMFRKKDFLGYDLNKPLNYLCDDLDLWCRSILKGLKFANIPEHLIYYRTHPGSLSNRFSKEIVQEADRILKQYKFI